MENNRIRFISLFAGIGGFDLGLERAGMECVAQVEIDPFCQQVLAKHWPNVMRLSDVRECGKHNLPAADLICGGFPCQPHSVAGKRRGAEDDRDLWPEYRRIIEECRPRWVIGENVPGIRTTILDQVLSDLEGLDYAVRTLVVPACAFDAPHRRERIFVIANSNSDGRLWGGQQSGRCNSDKAQREHVAYSERTGSRQYGLRANRDGEAKDEGRGIESQPEFSASGESVAHARGGAKEDRRGEDDVEPGDSDVANAKRERLQERDWNGNEPRQTCTPAEFCGWWAIEPPVGRVANGIPGRMDRLRALGNAVVPQVVEWIGRMIVEADKCA